MAGGGHRLGCWKGRWEESGAWQPLLLKAEVEAEGSAGRATGAHSSKAPACFLGACGQWEADGKEGSEQEQESVAWEPQFLMRRRRQELGHQGCLRGWLVLAGVKARMRRAAQVLERPLVPGSVTEDRQMKG